MASSSSASAAADAALQTPVQSIEWLQCLELGYSDESNNKKRSQAACFCCGKVSPDLSKCAKCRVAAYCSRQCQVQHWKKGAGGGHKYTCDAYRRVGAQMTIANPEDQVAARRDIFGRIRFYACPYAVQREANLGKGFLFLQSTCTLAEMSLPIPVGSNGQPLQKTRSILLLYLTVGEYDAELCRDDFELASVRTSLQAVVDRYDVRQSVVLLMRFRCGHVALGIAPLMPVYSICKTLGESYYADQSEGALQLNLDDI